MGVCKDYTGQVFGLLTAIENAGEARGHNTYWRFKCACGNTCKKVIHDVAKSVKRGQTPSCGCLYAEHRSKAATRHGLCRHPIYHTWVAMKQRCRDTDGRYKHYSGRGITVCDRWLNSFQNFYDDMIPSWKDGLTLDRIDVNKGYSPDNCRWADMKTQQRNKRNNHRINGITVTELAEKCGVARGTIYARIRRGVPLEDLTTPVGKLKPMVKPVKGEDDAAKSGQKS